MTELAQEIEDILAQIDALDDVMETAIAEDDLDKAKFTLVELQVLEEALKLKIDKLEEALEE